MVGEGTEREEGKQHGSEAAGEAEEKHGSQKARDQS